MPFIPGVTFFSPNNTVVSHRDGLKPYIRPHSTAPQNGQKRFPKISTIAYEPEGRVLQNEVYLAKFLGANFEIWEP